MKKIFIFSVLIFLCICLSGCSFNSKNRALNNVSSDVNNSYEINKLSVSKPIEETLYTFSTNILDKDSGRQTNIKLTCSSLNGTIVKAGETFSFCNTVGKATADRGYQKAKIFDADGNVILGYGGGNCQVSSTLYNAILQDSNFEVVERHPHSQRVYYVEER